MRLPALAATAGGLLLLLLPPAASAGAADALDGVISKVIRANYERIHACFRLALAEDRASDGTVFVRVTLGRGDRVKEARAERDELGHRAAVACLLREVGRWRIAGARKTGAGAGSDVVIPLTLRPARRQVAVWRDDVAATACEQARPKSKAAGRVQRDRATRGRDAEPGGEAGRAAPCDRRRLLHAKNVGARQLELDQVAVQRGGSYWLRPVAFERALYVLGGTGLLDVVEAKARAAPPGGQKAIRLRQGSAVWLDPLARAQVKATGNLVLLELRVRSGRWNKVSRPVSVSIGQTATRRVGPLTARPLLWRKNLGHSRLYLGLLTVVAPSTAPRHTHLGSEVVYVLSGAGRLEVDGRSTPVGPEQAIYIPGGAPHSIAVKRRIRAVQMYVPGGPEERFFKPRRGLKPR